MKKIKRIVAVGLCIGILTNFSSCLVFVGKENGQKKGWNKNSNNPHHPNSTNPGKSKGKSGK